MWKSGAWIDATGERLLDGLAWGAARRAVDVVRYRPRELDLMLACGAGQAEAAGPVARWLLEARTWPSVREAATIPHRMVRLAAAAAARVLGPTASAVVRWSSGAVAAAADHAGAATLQQPLRARAHPGLLVPHPHQLVLVAVDMRGFSHLTRVLHDTQYLADLIGEYLTETTEVIEAHRGVVFQYTGDGLLAIFLPELAGASAAATLERVVDDVGRALHAR